MSEVETLTIITWVAYACAFAATTYRWLRVAQREHYAPGRTSAIALLWIKARPLNILVLGAALALLVAGAVLDNTIFTLVGLLPSIAFPVNLKIVVKESPLVFTKRVWRLTTCVVILFAAVTAITRNPTYAALVIPLIFLLIDLALAIMQPIETAAANKFVKLAQKRLASVNPEVIAITGSYGKTSTKLYTAQLLSGYRQTVASPASFNNKLGLSSTVNNSLLPGTELFIAEMGTYGPGEIRNLCTLFTPTIVAITTIGEAHLERMGDRETVVRAKSEILEGASKAILNIDVPELAHIANTRTDISITRVSGEDKTADVCVTGDSEWEIYVGGELVATIKADPTAHRTNLAVAVGLALATGMPADRISSALQTLPKAAHRAEVTHNSAGFTTIDDTYNANPVGAAQAIAAGSALAGDNTLWTITPGMMELGHQQFQRNAELAGLATARSQDRLVIVGYTNRKALVAGSEASRTIIMKSRSEATAYVSSQAGPGDVLLYENDLPNHYP